MHKKNNKKDDPREKIKMSESWGKLLKYCKPYIFIIVMSIIFIIGGTVLTLVGPNVMKDMTDIIIAGVMIGIDLDEIARLGTMLIIMFVAGFFLSYAQGFIMAIVTQKVSRKLRGDISIKINKLPLQYFDKNSYGNILSRMTNDVDIIGETLSNSIGGLVQAVVLFFGSLLMMFITNYILAFVAIASTIFGFGLMMLMISRSQKYFVRGQEDLGVLNGHIEEIYTGHNIVKAYNGEDIAKKEFQKTNNKLFNNVWKSQFVSGMMMPFMGFIGNLGYVAVCVVGAVLVLDNKIGFGVIVAFMLYIRLFTQPLSQFAQVATGLQSAAAASSRVFNILEEEELEDEAHKKIELPAEIKGKVEFRNVNFGYSADKIIVNDFSAIAKAGQKIAIVGPTGAGKTTMVNLLMRFYEVNNGDILIDDISIKDMTREQVHSLFCMVLQDTWIFNASIRDNIVYSKENVTEEQVIAVSKVVGIDHFIRTMSNGYDTILDENTNISAGQKQLITIARAMIEDAPLLILDEATSSVDTRTEVLIQEAMDKLTQGRTSFVIAHRLSTIKNADLILVMKDGDILESGSHNELVEREDGFYKELYNSQFA